MLSKGALGGRALDASNLPNPAQATQKKRRELDREDVLAILVFWGSSGKRHTNGAHHTNPRAFRFEFFPKEGWRNLGRSPHSSIGRGSRYFTISSAPSLTCLVTNNSGQAWSTIRTKPATKEQKGEPDLQSREMKKEKGRK
jgi:hypothetical protein